MTLNRAAVFCAKLSDGPVTAACVLQPVSYTNDVSSLGISSDSTHPAHSGLPYSIAACTMDAVANLWKQTVATHDAHAIDVVGSLAIQVVFWWLPCLFFASLDSLAPAFSARHKMQPAPKQPTAADVWRAVAVSARNQALVTAMHLGLALASSAQGRRPG
ncbi:Carboxypeptidase, partial [Tolypocladium capitatum]